MQERERRAVLSTVVEGTTGSISIEVKGFNEVLHYSFDVSQLPTEFLIKLVEAGVKARFTSVLTGIKDANTIFTTSKREIDNLNNFKYGVRESRITKFDDLVVAYALSELADTSDLEVMRTYHAKVAAMSVPERKTLRTVPVIKIQLNNLENIRLENSL
jgi:hypothetical protein